MTIEKTIKNYLNRSERADTEFGDAFSKLARRKSRAAELFDAITKESSDEKKDE